MNFLHFSDLHISESGNLGLWGSFESTFFRDLERLYEQCGPWDLILFTGDLSRTGKEEEFSKLNEVLRRIKTFLQGLPKRCPLPLFLAVPGNHDLERPDPTGATTKALTRLWLDDDELKRAFWTRSDSDYRRLINEVFSNYEKWWQSECPFQKPEITSGLLPGDFAATIETKGMRVGIVGLNTAFLQLADGNFEGRLAVDYQQLTKLLGNYPDDWVKKHHVCLLMTHHPPSWLNQPAKRELSQNIAVPGRFAFHLFGHMHIPISEVTSFSGASVYRHYQACSLFSLESWIEGAEEMKRIHGYSSWKLDFNKGKCQYRVWPRRAFEQPGGHLELRRDPRWELQENDGGTRPQEIDCLNRMQPAEEFSRQQAADIRIRDSIPAKYVFDYEKDMIEAYVKGKGELPKEYVSAGCPREWPDVVNIRDADAQANIPQNPLHEDKIGDYRSEESRIVVDARRLRGRSPSETLIREKLTFPEAGPRQYLLSCRREGALRVGIIVSGGLAPGINAVINGIVERHHQYANAFREGVFCPERDVKVYGYIDGFKGLVNGATGTPLSPEEAKRNSALGGSMLSTSRSYDLVDYEHPSHREQLLSDIVRNLNRQIDMLYVIGGDGSMRAAHAIWELSKTRSDSRPISVIGIPKTMDNDILWVWESFGFVSAVERARQTILQLHTEVRSNPRLCVIQLFGSDSGFVVSHAVLGSGVCDLALIPEMRFTMEKVSEYIKERLQKRLDKMGNSQRGGPYGVVVMSETAIPQDVNRYINLPEVALSDNEKEAVSKFADGGRRVYGKTPDDLRIAGLKIVSRVLQTDIRARGNLRPYWRDFEVFTNEPRHLIRSMEPNVKDVIFGHRLGTLAVDNAMAGYTDFMISQWLTEFVLVPLNLVVIGRKRVPLSGVFWKSVIANTGQPSDLGESYN